MLKFTFSMIALVPAALAAQVTATSSTRAQVGADAQVGKSTSVSASTSVEAEVAAARERGLPERPIRRRVAEGRAKGASEAQVTLAARRVRMSLETTQEAMVRAGRARPSDQEVEGGAFALERGYTPAQIEAVVSSTADDRSLVVAFDVLAKLSDRGISTANALAQVQSKLEARAPDAAINALVSTNAAADLGVGGRGTGAIGANAAAGVAATAKTGGASVTGAVKGIIKP